MTPITLGEIINETSIVPFPSLEYNTPPDGLVNSSSGVMVGSSDSKHFINIQAAVTDSRDRLWVLDTGRPIIKGDTLPAAPGGPKLMGFNLTNNATTPFSTITFPENVLPTTGYLNDIRIDLRTNVTEAGKGIAYISDSGGFGIIVVDLGTGQSWRHLDRVNAVSPVSRFLPTLFGIPTYAATPMNPASQYETTSGGGGGCDGLAISADGETIFFTPLASRDFYQVDTAALRIDPKVDNLANIKVEDSVRFLGQMGGQADGLETDSTGKIYLGSPEHNAINTYSPVTGKISPFIRSPMIAWPDTMSVADDGFLYATLNQLWLSPGFQNGTDKRTGPFALMRVKIDGTKVKLE
ncbi:hypothetical protein ONZ45_g6742 [Pleurotus djamor]|nr:hypothetical protein ONZ45_g6742 [Pleurotus djamor]